MTVTIEDEPMRTCRVCGEDWIESEEFFELLVKNGVASMRRVCRACVSERRNALARELTRKRQDPTSSLSERLLWQGYGMDAEL